MNKAQDARRSDRMIHAFTIKRFFTIGRVLAPFTVAIAATTTAHAQGTIDLSGATTIMTTIKTFAMYAGAIICLISLVFAGIKMMSGRFSDSIPALGGAIFGAGVLGWGAGWITSLTGQSVSAIVVHHSSFLA